jgi:hypothetical protein
VLEFLLILNKEDKVIESFAFEATELLSEKIDVHQTDWSSIENAERWARTFSDVVTQIAGADVNLADSLRSKLQMFVTVNRSMLKPTGAVGASLIQYRDAYRNFTNQLLN